MRNIKKLWFIIKLLFAAIIIIGLLAIFVAFAPMYFFVFVGVLFLVSLWFICDDFI